MNKVKRPTVTAEMVAPILAQMDPKEGDTIAVWFSCGAASAVALKKTQERYGNLCSIRAINNPVMEEHPDNRRFLKDVSKWVGIEIEEAKNPEWPNASAREVWEKRKFMSGKEGAPCTGALKREARHLWECINKTEWLVMGFTEEETRDRYWPFIFFERRNTLPILQDARVSKADCFEIVGAAGIKLPEIYDLGYPNANCIGCVKASSPAYWNHVRKMHPEVFKDRAEQSRRLATGNSGYGNKLVRYKGKRIFLDELPEDAVGRPMKTMQTECGIFCPTFK
jgi:3'-phosphoadenosine 5'-phosphosulfate sulfotransferase (PAPS reductase)/FAD synthetase